MGSRWAGEAWFHMPTWCGLGSPENIALLWDYLHFEVYCGWHHLLGWGPGLYNKRKWTEGKHPSFSFLTMGVTWCYQLLPAPASLTSWCTVPLRPFELWGRINPFFLHCFYQDILSWQQKKKKETRTTEGIQNIDKQTKLKPYAFQVWPDLLLTFSKTVSSNMLIWGGRHKHPVYSNELEIFLEKKRSHLCWSLLCSWYAQTHSIVKHQWGCCWGEIL